MFEEINTASIEQSYRELAIGILMQALLDYFEANQRVIVPYQKAPRYRVEAADWFAHSEQFELICECLDIDADEIRKTIASISDEDRGKIKGNGKQKMLEILCKAKNIKYP